MISSHPSPAHTPGPWYADLVDLIIYHGKSEKIAVVHQQIEPTEDSDVTSANARLIAAAPELLEALDCLLRQTVDMDLAHGIELTEGERDARQKAIAAIAKTRGRS